MDTSEKSYQGWQYFNNPSSISSVLIIGVFIFAYSLWEINADLYYLTVQEDADLEWSSFWAFLLAAFAYFALLIKYRLAKQSWWFVLGLSAFCIFVAMEEISWGQRLFGYLPPEYFLENNVQQEFSLHNIMTTNLRKNLLTLLFAGFGIILPISAQFDFFKNQYQRLGLLIPPLTIVPGFAFVAVYQHFYPLKYTNEWVELAFGLGLCFVALDALKSSLHHHVISFLWIVVAGVISASVLRSVDDDNLINFEMVNRELAALGTDFQTGPLPKKCGSHKRLYSYQIKYKKPLLLEGEYSRLTNSGLSEDRAVFLIDPWNYPYWVRDSCSKNGEPRTFKIYSFGPNRRRDSTKQETLGDDIALLVRLEGAEK